MKKKKIINWMFGCIVIVIICFCYVLGRSEYTSWHLNYMNIDGLWGYSRGENQVIAFIDTGISEELQVEFSDRIIYSYNVIEKSEDVNDYHGHGTEMISVACSDGYLGVYGIAPKSDIIVIKAVSDEGKTNNDYLYEALLIAEEKGATIVNVSLGGFKSDERVIEKISSMTEKNITIVSASGDYGNKDLLFPASCEDVVSVEAFNSEVEVWEYSNISEKSIVRMPGTEIEVITIDRENKLIKDELSGTSEACSITSGYVALIRSFYEKNDIIYNNYDILEVLQDLNSKGTTKIKFNLPFTSIQ